MLRKGIRRLGHIVSPSSHAPALPQVVDVANKEVSFREASAEAFLRVSLPGTLPWWPEGISEETVLTTTASVAGVSAAKKCSALIPMCHNIPLHRVFVEVFRPVRDPQGLSWLVRVVCTSKTQGRTGVEMESLVGASVGALTLYDMMKGITGPSHLEITQVRLLSKTGGQSGAYDLKSNLS